MDMENILFFINSLRGGGAEKVLVNIANELANRGYSITVQTLYGDGIYHNQLDKRIKQKIVFQTNTAKTFLGKFYYRLRMKILCLVPGSILHRFFVRDAYDVEIAYVEGMSTKIISAADKAVKKYAWVHNDPKIFGYSTASYMSSEYEKKCYRRFDKVFCVSTDVKVSVEEKYGVKAFVQLNSIDEQEIQVKADEFVTTPLKDAGMSTKEDLVHLITVGRLVQQKGYDRLIRALGKLKKEGFVFTLEILGDGVLLADLQDMAQKENVSDCVSFRGFQSNPYPFVKAADLFVCTSLTEGFSTAVSEAIILGVPVLTTDCAGMRDIFGDSGCGMIVENSDNGIYLGLKELLSNRQKILAMKQNAKCRRRFFSIKKRTDDFIENVLS